MSLRTVVTQFAAALGYHGQTGALNEHLSDAFGIMVKQWLLGQTADKSDWLIGAEIFGPAVHGVAVRSMAAPGTAYDDPVLGKDPQPSHMHDYVETTEDNGGVHINSGILNHAFYRAAIALGGKTWEVLGRIWYVALTDRLRPEADFADFVQATVDIAGELYGNGGKRATDHRRGLVGRGPVRPPRRVCDAAHPHQEAAPARTPSSPHGPFRRVAGRRADRLPHFHHHLTSLERGIAHMSTNPKELNPLEASKAMIEKSKRSTDRTLRALNMDMEQENTLVQDTPNGRLQKVLKIYRGIKPVFAVIGSLPLIPSTWRAAIVMFTQALDALAVVGGEITAEFKAGKDLAEQE